MFADLVGSVWPDAEIYCFEPEPEYVEQLSQRATANPRLHVCAALLGAEQHPAQAYHFHLGASSVLPNAVRAASAVDKRRSARMITLDGYCREHRLSPDFLKIDVQGYELEVLKGAEQVLAGIEVVFTEVNHIAVYDGAPLAAELIGWLADHGYALHDVCNFMPRPRDGALWQTDMVFVRHESPLRASREW